MRCWSPCSLLVVIVLYCFSSHRSEAFDLAQACVESQRLSLLPICETIFAVQQDGAQQSVDDGMRSKRFIRFGRALSGDAFLRFGKNVPDLPFEDKRFLRFGRAAPQLDDLLKQALQRVETLQKVDETSVRRKRSTDAAPHSSNVVESTEPKSNNVAKITKRYAVDDAEDTDVKRFMRFGKRFMRFGRNPADVANNKLSEKRFMRFGRDPEKRFMRFGKSDEKRFMRFGRDPADAEDELEEEKRFMRFGRAGGEEDDEDIEEAEKRFMRFGRDPEKKFMRFGKSGGGGGGGVEGKRFMRFGRNPEEQEADKRFMRFGRGGAEDNEGVNTEDKRFMRFGRSAEKCKGCLED